MAFIRNITSEKKQTELLISEKKHSEHLLMNILPKKIAEKKMANPQKTIVDTHSEVTCLFSDLGKHIKIFFYKKLVGFTDMSSKITPEELIIMLNTLFSKFDDLTIQYKIEKIKTIGNKIY